MSSATGPQALSDLLTSDPRLCALLKARSSAAPSPDAAVPVVPALPPALADHCRVIPESDHLLLIARNSSVAQMLRFHGARLAREARLPGFRVRVDPAALGEQAPVPRNNAPIPSLAPEAARTLRHLADTLDDPSLRAALERLAALAESPGGQ